MDPGRSPKWLQTEKMGIFPSSNGGRDRLRVTRIATHTPVGHEGPEKPAPNGPSSETGIFGIESEKYGTDANPDRVSGEPAEALLVVRRIWLSRLRC
jgi:hypothetical protein